MHKSSFYMNSDKRPLPPRVAPVVFQEHLGFGFQTGPGRWCFTLHKDRVLKEIERRLPQPQVHVDGVYRSIRDLMNLVEYERDGNTKLVIKSRD